MNRVYYIVVSVLILSITLNAGSLRFAKKMGYEIEYQSALQKAKDSNKPIMLVIGTKTCPWCRKLETQTLKKENVHDLVSNKFIPVSLTKEVDQYPFHFDAKVVPTVFFINPFTEQAYFTSKGYKNKHKYKKTLEVAIRNYKGNI